MGKRGLALRTVAFMLAGLLALAGTPLQSTASEFDVAQKTLASFSGSDTFLSPKQKAQIYSAVAANRNAEKFICTGIRYYNQSMSVNITVRKRAKAACDYAKELNPNLSTWFQNKPTKARSYAGKVLLTIKSPKNTEQAEVTRGFEDQPDAVLGFQIKPIYMRPADAPDTAIDTNGTIAATIVEGQELLKEQLGHLLRFLLDS